MCGVIFPRRIKQILILFYPVFVFFRSKNGNCLAIYFKGGLREVCRPNKGYLISFRIGENSIFIMSKTSVCRKCRNKFNSFHRYKVGKTSKKQIVCFREGFLHFLYIFNYTFAQLIGNHLRLTQKNCTFIFIAKDIVYHDSHFTLIRNEYSKPVSQRTYSA